MLLLPKVQLVPTSWGCIGKARAHNCLIFDVLLTFRCSLLGPGDHVICVYPTYQQLYDVPRSIGAEVTLWKLKEEENFVPNTDDLVDMIQDNTKVRTKAI
jgi:aspartate/methionine/tyrosine aminotransferase